MLLPAHPSYVGGMMIISCGSFQDTAWGGGREGDAAAMQQLRWEAAPISGCLHHGLVVDSLPCQLHPHLPAPRLPSGTRQSVRVEGQILPGGTSCQRSREQTERIAPGSSLHTQLAEVACPRGRACTSKRHCSWGASPAWLEALSKVPTAPSVATL